MKLELYYACLALVILTAPALAQITPKTFTYKSAGGVEIKADVYRPGDEVARPVIAWYHGGALIMGNRKGVPKQLRELSEKEGFVLVSFDYRLAPEVKLPAIIEDLKDGLQWVRDSGPKLFHADPDRLVVAGASAGGYLAMMSGIALDPPPAALVAYWGFGDVDGDWCTEPAEYYRNAMGLVSEDDARAGIGGKVITGTDKSNGRGRGNYFIYLKQNGLWAKEVGGFDPETEPEKLVPFCPVKNLSENYPPILMLHGTADKDVPYEKSADMARELFLLKRPHELITVENGGHGLWGGDKKEIEAAFERSLDYIREHLTKELPAK